MFDWLDRVKQNESTGIDFLKFSYAVGKSDIVSPIIETILSVGISIFVGIKIYWVSIILGVLFILTLIFHSLCSKYEVREYEKRKYASEILDNQSSMIKSMSIEIESNKQWKNTIFAKNSELVCEKIRRTFREVFKCDTRVSVEYVFDKIIKQNGKKEKYVKMSGRKSKNRDYGRGAVPLEKRKVYFSYKIFNHNKTGLRILREEDINNKNKWYKNPEHSNNIKMYMAIAVSVRNNSTVDFILQIDFLRIPSFLEGKSDEEIQDFVNQYLTTYINIISLSYLLNLSNNHRIPEV